MRRFFPSPSRQRKGNGSAVGGEGCRSSKGRSLGMVMRLVCYVEALGLWFIVGLGDKEAEKKVAVGFNDPWRTRMLLEG